MKKIFYLVFIFCISQNAFSQTVSDSSKKWTAHFQLTSVYQSHNSFSPKYSGVNSLDTAQEEALSLTTTLFLGRRLWKGAAIYFNPEISGGSGLSKTTGIAGFPNGEIYRVGNPKLTLFIARAYLEQTFAVGNSSDEFQEDGKNQLATMLPSSRITIRVGKFCISDFFDNNSYNHDARSQFLNWSMMSNGSWDFPADTRGYTKGIEIELVKPAWAIRFAAVQVPKIANGLPMDWNLLKGNSETLEYERKWHVQHHPGAIRATGFMTFSKAPYYKDAIDAIHTGDTARSAYLIGVLSGNTEATSYGGVKYGFGINGEQEVANGVGVFTRISWSDGHSGTWAFTEIDRSLQAGINLSGSLWRRPNDNFALGGAVNGLSSQHRDYLAAGGVGFIIGDGKLNYAPEYIFETYYKATLNKFIALSLDYQCILNPGYNKDRHGPISVPGVRVHIEI
ncbi:carbohydrate-selective porin (OprB family) [Chitinophaga niastensis]|uniref:Carbohydrate-selective porin (OprB family) n=1 Tax=Chitinophaga niastensis TaxID=536980 RepID=A0A2P8H8Z7_CHINA|nr:carbohydrate porin [Chitinophaga niastensis]PSL42703.1 carbohydrate-selective porin (OprB family) [Chitinophaga niastensis]